MGGLVRRKKKNQVAVAVPNYSRAGRTEGGAVVSFVD